MATATAKRLKQGSFREQATFPVRGVRVDRENGIIYGVKIVGTTSKNNHGQPGVTAGTEYPLSVLREALDKYEGLNVNLGPHLRGKEEPDPRDRFCWLEQCEVKEGVNSGIFGDLHFLDAKHEMAVRIMNAAEKKPDAFALSHHATGAYEIVKGKAIVQEILEVRVVDIVTEGGSVASLFESGKTMKTKTKTVRQLLESIIKPEDKTLARLMESKPCKDLMEADPMAIMDPTPPAPEEEPEEDYATHIGKAIVALLQDDSLTPEEKKKKVLVALKLMADDETTGGGGDSGGEGEAKLDEGEGDKKPPDNGDDKAEKKKDDDMKESKELSTRLTALETENNRLKEEQKIAQLCESLHVGKPDPTIMEVLLPMDQKKRTNFIEKMRPALMNKGPRSRQVGEYHESEEKTPDLKDFVRAVTR